MRKVTQFNLISIFALFVLMITAGIIFNKTSAGVNVGQSYPMVIQGQVIKSISSEKVDLLKNIPLTLKDVSTRKIFTTTTSDIGLYNFKTSLKVGDYELFNTKENIYFKFKFYPSEDIANTAITINLIKRSKMSYSNQAVFAGTKGHIYGLDSALDPFQTSDLKYDDLSLPYNADIVNITLIGNSPKDILITTLNAIYKSTTGGAIWYEVTPEKIRQFIPPNNGLMQTDDGAIITFVSGDSVFVSTNQGETWKKIGFKRPAGEGGSLISGYFTSLTSGKILLSTGVFSTANGGASWTKEPTDDREYYKYYCDKPPSPEELAKETAPHLKSYNSWNPQANPPLAYGENGLYQEYNQAKNVWENKPVNTEWCLSTSSKTTAGITYLAGVSLIKRREGSGRFAPMQSVGELVHKIEMMGDLKGFAAVSSYLYKTVDGWVTKTTEKVSGIIDIAVVKDVRSPATVTVPPVKLPNIWLYGSSGIQFSRRDNLKYFQYSPLQWTKDIIDLDMKTADNKIEQIGFIIGIGQDKSTPGKYELYRTEEGGYSWRPMNSPDCEKVSQVEMFNETSVVIVCNDNEIKFSSDRGNTFKKIEVPMSAGSKIELSDFMVSNDYIVFQTDQDELFYGYLDNNNLILKQANKVLNSIGYGINKTGQVFAFTTRGVFRSQINKSATILDWVQISPKDLTGDSITTIVYDNTSILIVSNNKLDLSSDNGEHWSELNTGEIDLSTVQSAAMIHDEIVLASDNGPKKIIYYSPDKGIHWSATESKEQQNSNVVVVE